VGCGGSALARALARSEVNTAESQCACHSNTSRSRAPPGYPPSRKVQHSYPAMPAATEPYSRSPSPTPAPPIADAPGPRAQGLINVFNQASKATLEKCSNKNFASCFPTAAQYSPEVLDNLRGQIVDQLDRTWKTNFEDIMERRNVVKLLNSLDQCIEDAKLRKKRAELSANGGPVEVPVP
jgi:kinetochore protein NNF1